MPKLKQHSIPATLPKPWHFTWEKLPDDNTTVCVFCLQTDEPVFLGYHDMEDWFDIEGAIITPSPVAWRPMPYPIEGEA